jgi:hypothetical protein
MHEGMCQIWMVDVHDYIKEIYCKKLIYLELIHLAFNDLVHDFGLMT